MAGSVGIRCKGQVRWGDPGAVGLGTACSACGCVCAQCVAPTTPTSESQGVQAPRASGVPRDWHARPRVQDTRVNPGSSLTYGVWSCLLSGLLGGRR